MRGIRWAALACILLLIAGCSSTDDNTLKRPKKFYNRIVSLSPGLTEIAFLDLGTTRLVGRTAECNYPSGVEKVPIVMSGQKPVLEAIAAAKPDLIIYDPTLFPEQDVQKLKELGIELYGVKTGSIAEFRKSLLELGGKTKAETGISEYVDKIDDACAHAKGAQQGTRPKVAVIMPGRGSEHFIAGVKSFQDDIVRASGGAPVGPDADRFVTLNVESLMRDDPDYVLVAGDQKDKAAFLADPRLQSLKAVKTKHVLQIDPDIILRAGSRVDAVILKLAEVLGS